ncbi:substrate-binding periplasmic protein [Agarivorans sp. QJM3NY_29]|uniref:substrate-binding periplasmic protein n=1 Tax=unclassified Agarivorans TaxID=2636026 RepID=UPI003D7D7130
MQFYVWLRLWLSLILLNLTPCLLADELRVVTHVLPPYTVLEDQRLSGSSVDLVYCTLNSLNQPYSVTVRPVSRAEQQLELGLMDMFFIASETSARSAVAAFSQPVAYARRMLYGLNEHLPTMNDAQIRQLTVGVLHGSAMHRWLLDQQFPHIKSRYNYHILFEMLDRGRIDSVLAPEDVYQQELSDQHIRQKLYSQLMKYIPIGVYISHTWLAEHPGFMAAFNQHLQICKKTNSKPAER